MIIKFKTNLVDTAYIKTHTHIFKNQKSNRTQGSVFNPQQYSMGLQTQKSDLVLTNFQG